MNKKSDLKDDQMLRIARIVAIQSAAGAYVEVEHDTQLSIERGVIWQIHAIEFGSNLIVDTFDFTIAQNQAEWNKFQITRESCSETVNLNDSSLVTNFQEQLVRSVTIGTDAGPLWYYLERPKRIVYPVPYPFAGQNIYFGFDSTNDAALTVTARIFYTTKTVTDKYFFRVAQSLLS